MASQGPTAKSIQLSEFALWATGVRDCPIGEYHTKENQGSFACLLESLRRSGEREAKFQVTNSVLASGSARESDLSGISEQELIQL